MGSFRSQLLAHFPSRGAWVDKKVLQDVRWTAVALSCSLLSQNVLLEERVDEVGEVKAEEADGKIPWLE